jgi:hypothetical protein
MSCGGSTEPLAPCSGPVDLAVSPGTSPVIAWTPACGATALYVDPQPPSLGMTHERWLLMAGERMLEPRIRYGHVPSGTTERAPAAPLVAGQPYTLVLDGMSGRLAFKIVTP